MTTSVVIPTKNRPSEVHKLLGILLKQSVRPNEVIIADDSANLATEEVVKKYESIYSSENVELKHIWDLGSSARARTLGGLMSRGEIIIYIDDDLIVRNDSIEILIKTLLRTKAMAVWGKIDFRDSRNFRLSKILEISYYHLLFGTSKYGGGLFAIRRKVLEDKILFDQNLGGYALGEDKDFAFNLYHRYGPENVIELESPVLAINDGVLTKDRRYYGYLFGITIYYSKKWGGATKLIMAFPATLFLCVFSMISEGGRGMSSINRKDIFKSYLNTLRNLKYVLVGNFDQAYK
jgi:glycosyltransferase involved in cell wall biosynthesis